MRLLDKSAVQSHKAREQRQTIEEGVKLAQRIDNLREVAAQEEAALTKFRSETIAKIHEEIKAESAKKEHLTKEVRDLEKRRQNALEPLDQEEKKLQSERAAIESLRGETEAEKRAVEDSRAALDRATKQLRAKEQRVASERERSHAGLLAADAAQKEAAEILAVARRRWTEVLEAGEVAEESLRKRDIHIAARERDVTMKEESVAKSRAKLLKEWKLLKDRKALFERNIKRLT